MSFSTKVLARDRECPCGAPATEAHHIYPKADYPEFRNIKENGIGLCTRCHQAIYGIEEDMIEVYLYLRPQQARFMGIALQQLHEARSR